MKSHINKIMKKLHNDQWEDWSEWHAFKCKFRGHFCRNPILRRVWGWDSHSQNGNLGIHRDSRNFRVRLQGSKQLAIWTSEAQVMAKKKVGSQTGNLTLDHQKSGIDPTPRRLGGVRHAIGKLSMRATNLFQTSSQSEVWAKSYDSAKWWESKLGQFRDSSLGVPG